MSVIAAGRPAEAARRARDRRGLRGTGAVGHVCAVVIIVVASLVGGVRAAASRRTTRTRRSSTYAYVGPVRDHYLGFDGQGRDLFSRLLVGRAHVDARRRSPWSPSAIVVGTVLAIAAAWRGGWLDTRLGGDADVLFAFPGILLAVLAAAVFGAEPDGAR